MSDEPSKYPLINFIPKSIDNAIENLTDPPTKEAGHMFGDIWFLIFGNIGHAAQKRRMFYAHDLDLFKLGLESSISLIPAERKLDPDLQIVGPALENAKFCISKKELRDMFTKLISNSMDSSKANFVHPSFGETIKQMTPLDAQNLKLFEHESSLPFCEYRIYLNNGTYKIVHNLVFISNPEQCDLEAEACSISSLCRLGLLEINSTSKLEPVEIYAPFYETYLFKNVSSIATTLNGRPTIYERKIQTTPYGEAFIKACLTDF